MSTTQTPSTQKTKSQKNDRYSFISVGKRLHTPAGILLSRDWSALGGDLSVALEALEDSIQA